MNLAALVITSDFKKTCISKLVSCSEARSVMFAPKEAMIQNFFVLFDPM